jgi:hypothetical protein
VGLALTFAARFLSSSRRAPKKSRLRDTCWRTVALFSPMPPVNTMASTPPMTAA